MTSRGLSSDAELLFRVTEFVICTKQLFWTPLYPSIFGYCLRPCEHFLALFPSTIALKLKCVTLSVSLE